MRRKGGLGWGERERETETVTEAGEKADREGGRGAFSLAPSLEKKCGSPVGGGILIEEVLESLRHQCSTLQINS